MPCHFAKSQVILLSLPSPKSRTDVMSQSTTALEGVEALVFDAFGTVTNWEDSISREVQSRAPEGTPYESK